MNSQRQLEGFYSHQQSHTQFTSILASQVYGCNQLDAKGKHQDIPLNHNFMILNRGVHCFIVWFFFFFHRIKIIFKILRTGPTFFFIIIIIWSQIQPCFNVCMESEQLLWFFWYFALFLQVIQVTGYFFFSLLMLTSFHMWNPNLVLCRLAKIK